MLILVTFCEFEVWDLAMVARERETRNKKSNGERSIQTVGL
jgi:hypothetical protein